MSTINEKQFGANDFESKTMEAATPLMLSVIAWAALFVFFDGMDVAGGVAGVCFVVIGHVVCGTLLYKAIKTENAAMVIISQVICLIDFLAVGIMTMIDNIHSAGVGLAFFGAWGCIKNIRWFNSYSTALSRGIS